MAFSVEVEVTAASFNGSDTLTCTFAYRLINEANQAVLSSKTVQTAITDISSMLEPGQIMRAEIEKAGRWAQWLVMANKASQYVGTKKRVPL